VDLHHVALATRDAGALVEPVVAELGGVLMMGGENLGFRSYQVRLGDAVGRHDASSCSNRGRPSASTSSSVSSRAHGAGPHHLTFKVPDLAATIERVRTSGYTPVGISLSDPRWWKEGLPPAAGGARDVVQLAQAAPAFPDFAAEFAAAQAHHTASGVVGPAPPTAAAL